MDLLSQVVLPETNTIPLAPQEKTIADSNRKNALEVESYFPGHPAILILFQEVLGQKPTKHELD